MNVKSCMDVYHITQVQKRHHERKTVACEVEQRQKREDSDQVTREKDEQTARENNQLC